MSALSNRPDTDVRFAPLTWREKWVVYVGISAVALIAWAYLIYMGYAMQNMHLIDMWMPPRSGYRDWHVADFLMLWAMWSVMMVAMMTPSVLPMISMFQAVNKSKRMRQQKAVSTYVFYLAYLLTWVTCSLVISLLQWPLHTAGILSPMMQTHNKLFSGLVLIGAGIYQWTPLKDVCLHHCRTPLSYVMTQWRDGVRGAFSMGFRHGVYCVGCCWGLMIMMFAVGVMNVLWMLFIAAFVLLEKTLPGNYTVFRILSGAGLVAWGAYWVLGHWSVI